MTAAKPGYSKIQILRALVWAPIAFVCGFIAYVSINSILGDFLHAYWPARMAYDVANVTGIIIGLVILVYYIQSVLKK